MQSNHLRVRAHCAAIPPKQSSGCGRYCKTGSYGWKFRRQVAIESYIVDFCCVAGRLIVEIDGDQHAEKRKRYDDARTRELEARGFRVIRFWSHEVLQGLEGVGEGILKMLGELKAGGHGGDPQNPHLTSPVK